MTTKKLYDHGRELVYDLDSERREDGTQQRPIIFIAHSLGGIVVKKALLHSDRVRVGNLEDQRSIKLSTYGIIFMGTPHQGGQGVTMGKVLRYFPETLGRTLRAFAAAIIRIYIHKSGFRYQVRLRDATNGYRCRKGHESKLILRRRRRSVI